MWAWAGKNLLLVGTIAVLLIVALASAGDSYRQRRLVQQLQANIQGQAEAKEKQLEEAEEAWLRIVNPATRERDALKKALAKAQAKPFRPPKDEVDAAVRWRELGYQVGVSTCK